MSIFRLPHGAKFSCAQKKISFRKKIYFLAEEKIFSCGRKFGRLPNGNFAPCGRKEISVRTKINFRICENIFSYIRKFIFLYTEILPLANPLGMRVVRRRHSLPLRRGLRQVGNQAFLPYSTNETSPLSSSELSGDA